MGRESGKGRRRGSKTALPWWVHLLESLLGGLGARGERAAAHHLSKNGYRILARNYRVKGGEADLVAEKDGLLVVVEVKTRSGGGAGAALAAVTPEKARRVHLAGVAYCRMLGISVSKLRLDAVTVEREGWGLRVTHFPGAVASPRT